MFWKLGSKIFTLANSEAVSSLCLLVATAISLYLVKRKQ